MGGTSTLSFSVRRIFDLTRDNRILLILQYFVFSRFFGIRCSSDIFLTTLASTNSYIKGRDFLLCGEP